MQDARHYTWERVVNQLLTEMDGLEPRSAIFVVAATNRPDMIDPAMLRPGRLDKLLYVPLQPPDGRAAILRTLTRKTPLAPGVDVMAIGESGRCNGFSGADLSSLVREACVAALRANLVGPRAVQVKEYPGLEVVDSALAFGDFQGFKLNCDGLLSNFAVSKCNLRGTTS